MVDKPSSLKILVETPKEENTDPKESVLEITLKQLFSTDKLEMKSDLSQDLILAMSRGKVFVDKFQSTELDNLINYILKLSVSKDRKGRIEMVDLARNMQDPLDDNGESSMFRRLFNGS